MNKKLSNKQIQDTISLLNSLKINSIDSIENKYNSKIEKNEFFNLIISNAFDYLKEEGERKNQLRKSFVRYFSLLLSIQILFIFTIIICVALEKFKISDNIIITMISSIFVETLAVVTIMVRRSFESKMAIEVIKTIENITKSYEES